MSNTSDNVTKPRCRICLKYTDKKSQPQCFGHGVKAGAGGDSGAGSGGEITSEKTKLKDLKPDSVSYDRDLADVSKILGVVLSKDGAHLVNKELNSEQLLELFANHLLKLENDSERGVLTISLQIPAKMLSQMQGKALEKLLTTILSELMAFKDEHNISSDCYKIMRDKQNQFMSLTITLPTPTLFDAFISRLQQSQVMKPEYQARKNALLPNALATKPQPSQMSNAAKDDQDLDKERRTSIRPKSLLDGLKPKGFA